MRTTTADNRGRIVIPAEFREKHGDRYRVVELRDSLKLIPIGKDPIDGFRDAVGDAFEDHSVQEVTKTTETDTTEQAIKGLPADDP